MATNELAACYSEHAEACWINHYDVVPTPSSDQTSNSMEIIMPNASGDDEAVAAIAAITAYLAGEEQDQPVEARSLSGWQRATKLQVQGLRAMRTWRTPRWGTVERLRRASGFYGVTGL
jgi:hypothetical protein